MNGNSKKKNTPFSTTSSTASLKNYQLDDNDDDDIIFQASSSHDVDATATATANNNLDDYYDSKSSKRLIERINSAKPLKSQAAATRDNENLFKQDCGFCSITIPAARVLFMIFIVTLLVLSFFLFIPISQLYIEFSNQCPLYSNIYIRFNTFQPNVIINPATTTTTSSVMVSAIETTAAITTTTTAEIPSSSTTSYIPHNSDSNSSKPIIFIEIDQFKTQYTKTLVCEYSMSIGVLILCYSIISLFFFIMFNMHDIIDNDDCLIVPWLILTIVLTICIFVSNCLITNGFSMFCFNLLSNNPIETSFYLKGKCSNAQLFEWKKVSSGAYFYNYFLIMLISSWLMFVNLLVIDFLLILRIRLNIKLKEHKLLIKVANVLSNFQSKFDNNSMLLLEKVTATATTSMPITTSAKSDIAETEL